MKENPRFFSTLAALVICAGFALSCSKADYPLIVYSGKGLMPAVEEAAEAFRHKHGVDLRIVYAGSQTLLETIQSTRKGDIYIPGTAVYIARAGSLAGKYVIIGKHVPVFVVRKGNPKGLETYEDLGRRGVSIAVGNKNMAAIGRTTEKIIAAAGAKAGFAGNITVTGSTVNELMDLVVQGEVDASLIWKDMLGWPEAEGLMEIPVPPEINLINEIPVAVLTTTTQPDKAGRFLEFMDSEGREIFRKHGFGG